MSRIKLVEVILEIKQLNFSFDEAARLIFLEIGKTGAATNISKDAPGYKYGAYSGEVPDLVVEVMRKMGMKTNFDDPDWYDKMNEFIDRLKERKLLYLEW